MKLKTTLGVLSLGAIIAISGCGSDSKSPSGGVETNTTDMVVLVIKGQITGFLNMLDGSKSQHLKNTNGLDIGPGRGVFSHKGFIYTTGSMTDNKVSKYSVNTDNSLKLEKEITVNDSGKSIPTSFIFTNNTKAYLPLAGSGELLVIDLVDLTIAKRIDLSAYAMDENAQLGGTDTNPEPSGGVIRDGKLYLGLGQVNTLAHVAGAFMCRGKASMLIIDMASDTIEKHITDDRTCSTGSISPGPTFTIDENDDIYVNNPASFGYLPNMNPGYLRIKNGESDFDPDYFFSLRELDLSGDFPDLNASSAKAAYAFKEQYKDGELYAVLNIAGLASNPPDFTNDRNFQPYKLDLPNKTATKLDMLPTAGLSAQVSTYKNQIIFSGSTVNGNGLYKLGEKTPYITTDGPPVHVVEVKR